MSPIQQMLLGAGGAVATKTYVDDIFSIQVWAGTSHTVNPRSVVNNLDLSTDGGLVWVKERTGGQSHVLFDTERGATKALECAGTAAEETQTDGVTAFNSNGFTVGGGGKVNDTGKNYGNWSWKNTPGFFDCVSYTGNASNRTISHSLGCVPGMIIVKRTDSSDDYVVYHRGISDALGNNPGHYYLYLNDTNTYMGGSTRFQNTEATSTVFSIGTDNAVNASGGSYVAYVFAGGESTAATACSVNFNGGSDYLTHSSGYYGFGTGDFTIEFWFKSDDEVISGGPGFFQLGHTLSLQDDYKFITVIGTSDNGGEWEITIKGTSTVVGTVYSSAGGDGFSPGQWYHVALVRHSSKTSLYVNGKQKIGPIDDTTNYNFDDLLIGSYVYNDYGLDGQISNFRIVTSAVYTSSFKPPTEPLTSITNTLLLCCQSSTITTATTKPGSYNIGTNGSPSASTDSPFDDPAGFVFGDAGDQNVIKCGSFLGSGSAGLEVNLGFEPQWLLLKNASASENWYIFDSMRGIITGDVDAMFLADTNGAEANTNRVDLTSTGFIMTDGNGDLNGSGNTIAYIAIRRPDGYVGKPPELGTDVFAMDTGTASTSIPVYDSGFPVDFAFHRQPASSGSWNTSARLMQNKHLSLDTTAAQNNDGWYDFDSNTGWFIDDGSTFNSTYQSWMFKRHAGMDVVCYKGNGSTTGHQIMHSLNKIPEMMWVKNRDNGNTNWIVYHKGLNGGSSPEDYYLKLDQDAAEADDTFWNDTAPTSTHFTVGEYANVNSSSQNHIAMLFASTDVSHVGYYSGDNSGQTITTGFQPRFIIIRNTAGYEWFVFDTVRGWSQNNQDWFLRLDASYAQSDHVNDRPDDIGHPLSTGFYLKGDTNNDLAATNKTGNSYIYYCHA